MGNKYIIIEEKRFFIVTIHNTLGNIEKRIFEENIWLIPCLSHDKYLILWQLETALRP